MMKKTFDFGKIDFQGRGRKCNAVTVEMEYREDGDKKRFSVSANIWNAFHSDIVAGGQCLDTIAPYIHNSTFSEILRLWKLYALYFHHDHGGHTGAGQPETPDFDRRPKRGSLEDKPRRTAIVIPGILH